MISAQAGAAALSGSVGAIGASISLAVSVASNAITNTVESYITGETVNAALNYSTSAAATQMQSIANGATVLVGAGYDTPDYSVANGIVTLGHGQTVRYNGTLYLYLGPTTTNVDLGNVAALNFSGTFTGSNNQQSPLWQVTTGTIQTYSRLDRSGPIDRRADGREHERLRVSLSWRGSGRRRSRANQFQYQLMGEGRRQRRRDHQYIGGSSTPSAVDLNNQNYTDTTKWLAVHYITGADPGLATEVRPVTNGANATTVQVQSGYDTPAFAVANGEATISSGQTVLNTDGALYKYIGQSPLTADLGSLTYATNFSNAQLWQVSTSPTQNYSVASGLPR